jgi:hypothetical protein
MFQVRGWTLPIAGQQTLLDAARKLQEGKNVMKIRVNLLLSMAMIALSQSAIGQSWITNGLVAHYGLDGNANDTSGSGINGVLHNVAPTNNRFGQTASALSFQGVIGSYVDLGAPASLQFTGDFTVTAWVNFSGGTANPRVVSYGADCGYELLTSEASSSRHWGMNLACVKFSAFPPSSAGEWSFIASCRLGSNAHIYVNGVSVVTNAVADAPTFPGNLILGRKSIQDELETRNYWGGAIDDVRFYNRALSPSELAQLYLIESFCSPHGAQATATLSGDSVVGAMVVDYGCGYSNPPSVWIEGGGGAGATATANMTNGSITGLVITSSGSGYTNAPDIYIESPPFEPTVSIAVSKVKVTQRVRVNHNYVLEASMDLSSWLPTGPQFTAQSESIVNEFDVDVVGRFFRIREVQ